MATPSDTSEITALFEQGVKGDNVVALIGKSEGTGLHDDFGRELADLALREAVGAAMGVSREEVADRVAIVLSGGSFGVVTPHVTVVTRELAENSAARGRCEAVGRGTGVLGADLGGGRRQDGADPQGR